MTLHHLETAIKVLYISGIDGQNLRSECKKHLSEKTFKSIHEKFCTAQFPTL